MCSCLYSGLTEQDSVRAVKDWVETQVLRGIPDNVQVLPTPPPVGGIPPRPAAAVPVPNRKQSSLLVQVVFCNNSDILSRKCAVSNKHFILDYLASSPNLNRSFEF